VRLFAKENGYLKFWTRLLESVAGGQMESGFWPSSSGLAGPGSVLLRSAPATFCNAAKLPTAAAAVPRKLRRVNALIIISPYGSEVVSALFVDSPDERAPDSAISKSFWSCAPHLVQDGNQNQRQAAPNK